jgi:hypothetical protein
MPNGSVRSNELTGVHTSLGFIVHTPAIETDDMG